MKTLYLVRHAKSSWKNTSLEDIKRPLNGRGRNNAVQMGKLLKKGKEFPQLIISSPAKRAYDTAKRIAMELGYPVKKIVRDERLYMAGDDEYFEVIKEVKKRVDRLMIVSHNFGLTIFANRITGTDLVNIPTAGVVRTDFDLKKWQGIKKSVKKSPGSLIFFESPGSLNVTGKGKNGI